MDKYYTSQIIIEEVASKIYKLLNNLKKKNIYVVDFSAGDGRLGTRLIELGIPPDMLIEYDIEPKNDRIISADWLKVKLPSKVKQFILAFNPPFGKSCHTACQFIDHALQMPDTRIVAAYLILPLYPIMFDNAKTHNIDLLPPHSFIYNDGEVSAPSCLHEVIARPTSFLNFKLYTILRNRPYYCDINNLSNLIAHDARNLKFSDVKDRLPIALIRKTGHYAGLTTIIIEKDVCTMYCYNEKSKNENEKEQHDIEPFFTLQKQWNASTDPIEARPWLSNDKRWHLTSFKDDIGKDGSRTGCGALKILPQEHAPTLSSSYLHKKMKQFIQYVSKNKDAVRGGGKGPQSIGIGTFYWITKFALADDIDVDIDVENEVLGKN